MSSKMKKIALVFIIIILFLLINAQVFSQTKEATSSVETASKSANIIEDKESKNFREKIASTVAELYKKNQKAIVGKVLTQNDNNLKIKSEDENEYDIKMDNTLTKIYQISGGQKKEIKISDVKKDSYVIVTGPLIDKTTNANLIYLDEQFLVKSGKITEVNKTDYFLKVLTTEKDNYILDIESYTKQQILNIKTLNIEVTGFSKIKEGDTIHFVVKKGDLVEGKEINRYPAQKILVIPQEYFVK